MKVKKRLLAAISSLLLAALLAYIVDKKYFFAAAMGGVLAFCSFVGMIHAESVALFPPEGVIFGIIYLVVGAFLTLKGFLFRGTAQKRKPSTESPVIP